MKIVANALGVTPSGLPPNPNKNMIQYSIQAELSSS